MLFWKFTKVSAISFVAFFNKSGQSSPTFVKISINNPNKLIFE